MLFGLDKLGPLGFILGALGAFQLFGANVPLLNSSFGFLNPQSR